MIVSAALKSYDLNKELAARGLGVSRLTAFLTVTLPQIRFSIITSALLPFLTTFDEVIVAMFVISSTSIILTQVFRRSKD